ncbi:hemerythrin domain-containing protein [Actinopolymorpha sp. B11F2]|uniref:hemerythrin domain-containing protein n=1 Tax=Actinopolymorpha sp. B11F2 TaxID=3160862 RepID=UPI0032E3779F
MTGLRVDELEALETRTCHKRGGGAEGRERAAVEDLLDQVRTIEWLLRLHLAAMREVTEGSPRLRPVEAEGSLRAFLELHDVVVLEMRRHLSELREAPTMDNARRFAEFWHRVIVPHAQAEDRVLWPLARSLGLGGLSSSVDSLEAEHHEIDELVDAYTMAVDRLEQKDATPADVVGAAQAVRGTVELHFGKEEESVLRPMQRGVTDEQFWPVVAEQDRTIGPWLRAHGWQATTAGR